MFTLYYKEGLLGVIHRVNFLLSLTSNAAILLLSVLQ